LLAHHDFSQRKVFDKGAGIESVEGLAHAHADSRVSHRGRARIGCMMGVARLFRKSRLAEVTGSTY
jgi:hypothetical protein